MCRIISVVIAVMLLSGSVLSACGGPAPVSTPAPTGAARPAGDAPKPTGWEAEWETLVAAAKKEGQLMIYSTPSVDVMKAVAEGFKQKYGITVEYLVGRGEELAKRMQAEQNAGMFNADVVISGGTTGIVTMKPQGLLAPLEPMIFLPEVRDPKAWRQGSIPFVDKDGYHLAMIAAAQRYILVNTDMVKPGEIKSFQDLLDPKWKGKITSNDPTIAGTGSAMYTFLAYNVWNIEQTRDYMKRLIPQEPVFTRDTRLEVEWVAKGKYPVGMATLIEQTSQFVSMGAPIQTIKVSEGVKVGAGAGGIQIPRKQAHPNASKVFVNWILTKDGAALFVKAFGNPGARADTSTEGISPLFIPAPDEKIYPDTEETTLARDVMMGHAREIFAALLK
ncbi:MAG: extracellular solute-binding protein [Chloroflexi bacterium]|nr:extracellular solute-binding protein [Chloroflexota bacterium]